MRNRLTILLLAVVTAGIAVTSVYLYTRKVEEQSTRGLQTRSVLVATRFIPRGVSGAEILEARAVEVREIPERYVSPGAFGSPQEIAALTLSDEVAAGEQLTLARFGDTETDAFAARFPDGTEALSLPLEHVRAVAGHVNAGDKVNAYVTAQGAEGLEELLKSLGIPSSVGVFDGKKDATRLLIDGLLVVEVQGATAVEGGSTTSAASNMTLAVKPKQAALLIHAQEKAKLWFTLQTDEGAS